MLNVTETRHPLDRMQAILDACVNITSQLDLATVLQMIADSAREVAGADYAALGLVGKDGLIVQFITSGLTKQQRELIGEPPRGHGLLGVLIRQGKPLRVPKISADPRSCGFPPNHPPMSSLLGVPVEVHNHVVGDLYVTDKIGADEFNEDDELWLSIFARQAAVAVQNANLYRQKEEFLSMTAHDLRAPLSAIKLSAGLLETSLPPNVPPALKQLAANIGRNSERLNDLLNDLLEITRLEHGNIRLKTERLELGELVAATLHTLSPLFAEKEQEVRLDRTPHLLWLYADRARLQQVFVNLLTNANKYTPLRGHIEISFALQGGKVIITVADNGQGIPPDEQAHIFDRYYRRPVHDAANPILGSGLGLPIARMLLELHGGHIRVESTPGAGSRFMVELPLSEN
jgi:signal transduction histidine kinase